MTIFDLLVAVIVGLITAFPLCKIAQKAGFKADWWVMLILVLLPILQLPYLYYIALSQWKK